MSNQVVVIGSGAAGLAEASSLCSTSDLWTTGPRISPFGGDEFEAGADDDWLIKRKTLRFETRERLDNYERGRMPMVVIKDEPRLPGHDWGNGFDELPVTASGKIQKVELRDLVAGGS